MIERRTYFSIAERYLRSAQNELANANPYLEVVAFKFYHSYECLASSLTLYFNRKVPKSHPKKLNTFLALAKREPRPLNIHNVAYLNMLFEKSIYFSLINSFNLNRLNSLIFLTNHLKILF